MLSLSSGPLTLARRRVGRGEDRRQDREVLGDVVGDRERRQRAARDQQLLADLDDLDQLRRVRVEVDHVARLAGGLRAGVHRHADVGLSERRRVVGAVAGHRDQPALALLVADQLELALRRGLGEEVVDARLVGDLGGGERVVAGDHHGPDAHRAQLVEAVAHPLLDHVLEVDRRRAPGCRARRRAACRPRGRSRSSVAVSSRRRLAARRRRRSSTIASPAPLRSRVPFEVDAAHPRLGAERDEARRARRSACSRMPVLLGEHDDRAALGRLVGERGELRGLGQLELADAGHREELGRLAVAERDRAGLVEQQHVDVAGGLDRAAGEREHVAADQPVHAGDPDRRQQRADRGRDQRHEQRDQGGHRDVGVGELGERPQRDHRRPGRPASGPASRMPSAISFGVLRRSAPSTSAIIRSRKLWPGSWVISTTIRSESTRVPPVTALRSPPASRMTGADSPGDRRLVDRGDALDHGPVAGDQLAGLDDDDVAARAARTPASSPPSRSVATVSVRIARSASAWALPRPSASASARLANTTVSQSQSATVKVNQAGSSPPPSGSPPNDLDQPADRS